MANLFSDGNKHEIVAVIDDFLSSTKSTLERVAPYYSTTRRHASSPVKREAESPVVATALEDAQQVGEIVKRRATQVFEEVKAGASNAVEVVQNIIHKYDFPYTVYQSNQPLTLTSAATPTPMMQLHREHARAHATTKLSPPASANSLTKFLSRPHQA